MPRRRPEPGKPAPTSGTTRPFQLPPHDLDAEAAVLCETLVDPQRSEHLFRTLQARHFYAEPNATIWGAIVELTMEELQIDIVAVTGRLRDQGNLQKAGGPGYIARLVNDTMSKSVTLDQHVDRIRDKARQRAVLQALHESQVEGHEGGEDWLPTILRRVRDAAETDADPTGAVLSSWRPLPLTLLLTAPRPRPWLLRHPTKDGTPCAADEGDGMLPLGKAGLFSAAGGVGKTYLLIQLAVAIATGTPWLSHFQVGREARKGKVLLALAEEDIEECHRRLYAVAEGLRLTPEQRQAVAEQVVVLPLAGKPVSIVGFGPDGVTIIETEELLALRRKLRDPLEAPEGWSLVVLDPLARWAGPDVESDNAAATRFIQAVESLCEVPGRPTVLVAHHSSKAARSEGKVDSRGVTAIHDGFRWQGTLNRRGADVTFEQAKSNYSMAMSSPLELKRIDGLWRVASEEEEIDAAERDIERQTEREARKEDAFERRVLASQRAVLDTVRNSVVPIRSRKDLEMSVRGNRQAIVAAVSRLLKDGKLLSTKTGFEVCSSGPLTGQSKRTEESSKGPSAINGSGPHPDAEEYAQSTLF